jgi:uncharacterized protein (TIGR02996 family)
LNPVGLLLLMWIAVSIGGCEPAQPPELPVSDESAFLAAISASPGDDLPRLVYADWLDERGDPRAAYLRAEVEHFSTEWEDSGDSPAWSLRKAVDPVWAARVSRHPLGILIPGLTFSGGGPAVTAADLRQIESHWQTPLPAEYAAFLLSFNGGRPSKPYLYSYADYPDGREEHFDKVRFFTTADRSRGRRPYLLLSVTEALGGRTAEGENVERLSQLMPVGTVALDDGSKAAVLAVQVRGNRFPQVTLVSYWTHNGVSEDTGFVHATDSFAHLLSRLTER